MTAANILGDLAGAGVVLALAPDRQNLTAPASKLTVAQRALVLAHKPEIVSLLRDAHQTTEKLLQAANRVCDQFDDGPEAREQMRVDCLSTPLHLRLDLLEHFRSRIQPRRPTDA